MWYRKDKGEGVLEKSGIQCAEHRVRPCWSPLLPQRGVGVAGSPTP